ncbi:MAG TPA: hypothetical protein DD670_05860, partial [Planctomycetaceae bacterium]|nr:hypothetical protein [Planctomycetaceae bacterium]
RSCRRGVTRVEFLVLVGVAGLVFCLVIPAIQAVREAARRAQCHNNLKQIGVGLHNHHEAHRKFPASNDVRLLETPSSSWREVPLRTPAEPDPSVGPAEYGTNFSWLMKTIFYMEEGGKPWFDVNLRAWDTSNLVNRETRMPKDPDRPCHQLYWTASIVYFKCPSFPDGDFCQANPRAGVTTNPYDPSTPYGPAGLTNYVALGATHSDSLLGVETNRLAGGEKHPNGVIYPGRQTSIRDMNDGTTNTIVVCETREVTLAAWYEGSTAAVFGLVGSPAFVLVDQQRCPGAKFGVPAEGTETTFNYGNDRSNPKRFYLAEGPEGVPWVHGPSSHHPGVVNQLFGDGSVRSMRDGLNPRVYMWLITRAGGEPGLISRYVDEE